MLDFACKNFKLEDIVKCGLGLTRADLKVFEHMLASTDSCTSEDLAQELKINLSTAQRALKRLTQKNVVFRSQQNLESGGYIFVYKIKGKPAIKKVILQTIDKWRSKVELAFDVW